MASTSGVVAPNQAAALAQLKRQTRRSRGPNPETALVRACLEILRLHRVMAWRQNSGFLKNQRGQLIPMGPAGAADITGILPDGRRLEVEVKRLGNHPTDAQWRFLRAIETNRGIALVVYSAEQLDHELRRLLGAITRLRKAARIAKEVYFAQRQEAGNGRTASRRVYDGVCGQMRPGLLVSRTGEGGETRAGGGDQGP